MSSPTCVGVLLIGDLLREELLKIKRNRQWILRRIALGASTNLLKEISPEDPKTFYDNLRMDKEKFFCLTQAVNIPVSN